MRIYEARINYNIINLGAVEAIDIPQKVVRYLQYAEEQNPAVENFWVVALDRKNKPIAYSTVTTGIATASLVHPREVFRYAIMQGACSIIVAHNHPSGDPSAIRRRHRGYPPTEGSLKGGSSRLARPRYSGRQGQ